MAKTSKTETLMKKLFLILIIASLCLASCTPSHGRDNFAAEEGDVTHGEEPPKKPTPPRLADYTSKDLRYTVTVGDTVRSVCFDVVREGVVTTASVTSPDSLAGMSLIYDAEGLRLRPPYAECDELTVSDGAATGLTAVFDIMKIRPKEDSYTDEGYFKLMIGDCPVRLRISSDGFPSEAVLGDGNTVRAVRFSAIQTY